MRGFIKESEFPYWVPGTVPDPIGNWGWYFILPHLSKPISITRLSLSSVSLWSVSAGGLLSFSSQFVVFFLSFTSDFGASHSRLLCASASNFGGRWPRLCLSLPSRLLRVKTKLNWTFFLSTLFYLNLSDSLSPCLLKVLRSCSLPSNFQSVQCTTPLVTSNHQLFFQLLAFNEL